MNNGNMPAMPMSDIAWFEGKGEELQELTFKIFGGLTKREYFAAMAMQGLLARFNFQDKSMAATQAVDSADALLKALGANNENN